MNKKNHICDNGKVAAVIRLKNLATTNRDDLLDHTMFSCFPPTAHLPRLGRALETTIVLSLLVDLSGTVGHADPTMLHNGNHVSHCRWSMQNVHSMLSFLVRKTTGCVWFEIVHEPISGSSIANVRVFSRVLEVLLPEDFVRNGHAPSELAYHWWMNCKISPSMED